MTKLADFSAKITELSTNTTDSVFKGFNKVTTYSSDRLNDLTKQAKLSLEGGLNQADNFSGYLVNSMQTRLNSLLNDWLVNHPVIFWLSQHPLITLVTAFVLGVILWRLLAAIAFVITATIDKVWLWIFRSPVLLLKSLFGVSETTSLEEEKLEITINPTQFKQIITQLNQITAQQQLIIQEINTLKQLTDKYPYLSSDINKPTSIVHESNSEDKLR